MDKSRNSSFKNTVWASVTLATLESTSIWKKSKNSEGFIEKEKLNSILTAAMVQLGYDIDGKNSFHKRPEKIMVRSSKNNLKGKFTEVYDFPVLPGHTLENYYLTTELVNFDLEDNSEEINLSDYGLEHYDNTQQKQGKSQSREDFVNELAMKSMVHIDGSLYI